MRDFSLAALAVALLWQPEPAHASAAGYEACRNAAVDARALKRCGTFREEVRECRALRPVGVDAPARCVEGKIVAWRSVLEREEQQASLAGLSSADSLSAWSDDLRALCRDPEDQRLAAERFGEPHAAFEAASCELRSTIRRTLQTSEKLRGF
ncbi:MAG: hypothetical protein AAFT19_00975 [Pseudomonadota bacterium]